MLDWSRRNFQFLRETGPVTPLVSVEFCCHFSGTVACRLYSVDVTLNRALGGC